MYLIAHRDRAVSRDELIDAVWGHSHLSDGTLAQTIFQLRRILDDSDGTTYVKSVRGFGYRWLAEVSEEPSATDIRPHPKAAADPARRPLRAARTAGLVAAALVAIVFFAWWWPKPDPGAAASAPRSPPERLALVLPVDVDDEPGHAWIRFGVMDLIAVHLREAGLAVVPSENTILLLRHDADTPTAEVAERLAGATGSGRVFKARARQAGTLWSVSIRSLGPAGTGRSIHAEAPDVLTAAQQATSLLAQELELVPVPAPLHEAGLRLLIQRIEASMLDQRMDEAMRLIESAEPQLREHPEVRLQRGRIALYQADPATAREILQSLLRDLDPARQPRLHGHVLVGLTSALGMLGDHAAARPLLDEALHRFDADRYPDVVGVAHMHLGLLVQEQGDFQGSQRHLAQAQRILQGIGDIRRQAVLATNMGVLETRNDRHLEALRHYEQARAGFVAVQHAAGELHVLAAMVDAHLNLLELPSAAALAPRITELLADNVNAVSSAYAHLNLATLLHTQGLHAQAEALLDQGMEAMDGHPGLASYHAWGRLLRTQWRLSPEHWPPQTVEVAADVVQTLADHPHLPVHRARAWLLQIRGNLQRKQYENASDDLDTFSTWAKQTDAASPGIYVDLARAELAAMLDDAGAARRSYESALDRAEASHTAAHVLRVAESYVPWLLRQAGGEERALLIANRLSAYSGHHYDSALLRLRVLQRYGPAPAWHAALDQTRSLAAQRSIPAELLLAPAAQLQQPDQP